MTKLEELAIKDEMQMRQAGGDNQNDTGRPTASRIYSSL